MDITWPVKRLRYRYMVAIPLAMAAVFAAAFVIQGVPLSMDFAGGTYLNVSIENTEDLPSVATVEEVLQDLLGAEVRAHQTDDGLTIETSAYLTENQVENQVGPALSAYGVDGVYKTQRMGSVITSLYAEQAKQAIIGAAIAMAIIIFIAIRQFTSVGGILLVVGLDMLGVFGGMALLQIPLSFGSVTGILLLIGYAVDTNILLSTKVLKRVGDAPRERAAEGMRTGMMMSGTSVAALLTINLILSPPLLKELSGVLIIGILVDMANTWLLNSGILLWHAERQQRRYHGRI